MKKFLLIIIITLLGSKSFSQNRVQPCNGNTSKNTDAISESIYFTSVGVNINKYDWKNPDVNCHINETLSNRKKSKWMKYGAWASAGIGAVLLISGLQTKSAVNEIDKFSGNPSVTESSSSRGSSLTVIGGIMVAGSIPLFIGASNKKKRANKHLSELSKYFEE